MKKGAEGHPVYSKARFWTAAGVVDLGKSSGFQLAGAASTLLWGPTETPPAKPEVADGIVAEAGFIGLLFNKIAPGRSSVHPGSDR